MSLVLHQALKATDQTLVKQKDLDCMVNYVGKFMLDDDHLFGCKFIFRYGMPGQFPTGEWGYLLSGDVGVHTRPEPKALDYRVSYRYGEIPEYEVKLKGLYEIIAPITNYVHRDRINLKDPYRVIERHLAALSRSIPLYLNYLVYKIFVGTETAKQKWYIKDWYEKYIEATDGSTNGYPFYLSEGYGVVNLSEVITKVKVTNHALKTKLESINKALRNESRKIEVDLTKNDKLKKVWPKNNMTAQSQKTFALFDEMCKFAEDISMKGSFGDTKYKHKNEDGYFKDWMPRISECPIVGIFNRKAWVDMMSDIELSEKVTSYISKNRFRGEFILTDLLDDDEGIIMQRDLIQCWILPQLSRYSWQNYPKPGENTRDFIYEFGHSIDTVDIYCSAYFKLKKP